MMKEICKLMFIITFSLLAFSCSEEGVNENTSGESSGKEQEIVLSMKVPAIKEPTSQLRSIGATQENIIQTLDLIAFRKDNSGNSYYDYHTVGKLTDNTQGASTQNSKVIVRLKDYEQELVFITNAGTLIDGILKSKSWKDTPKDIFLSQLEFALSGTNAKWNTISTSNYTALPMWGEISTKITQNTTQLSVTLLRMLAKIDVQLDETVTGLKSKFKLKSVRLYNTLTNGRIAPNSSAVQKTTNSISVTAPSLPETPKNQLGPLIYTDFTSPGTTDVAVRSSIYTFESPAPADDNPLEATCLVVGGLYDKDTKETYYRVDFLEDDGVTYKDILRNYRYLINITNVMDRGHEDPQEAFESKAENMQTEVEMWAGNNLAVSFNGQYFLYVNKNKFDFSRDACTANHGHNVLIVNTNYATSTKRGWIINNITDEDGKSPVSWLTVTAPNHTINVGAYSESLKEDSLLLTFSQNTTGKPRYANIIFAAGRLRYTVQVVQDIREGVSITFYSGEGKISGIELVPNGSVIDTLRFNYPLIQAINQDALPFTVTWTPKDAEVRVFETHRYTQPIYGTTRYLNFNTNPPKLRVISTRTGIFVYHIGVDFKHTPEDRQEMYYAQSALGFFLSNGVEELEKQIVIICYPPLDYR
ncbi:hypothetical protein AGMMS50239_14510 [Bacteroidia bacterium]|nr:hypothetical protein AGMMS50239_14510 [Bacteroidia bacterium]